ncbi:unnamed protein product [Caenorhabditis sp. 36 PRJEB53466]|nr:unnamed protein product [Caenorhabditis sp. 36 PRJEB53466]
MQWLVVVFLLGGAHADAFAEQVFRSLHVGEGNACYRMFNKTHQFGCQATSSNENGLLVRIDSHDDFRSLETCYRSTFPTYSGKFWVLLPVDLIRRDTISLLKSSNCTAGLVLFDPPQRLHPNDEQLEESHDSECPNAASDYYLKNGDESYCQRKTNARGAILRDGLLRIDWRFQMVFINNRADLEVLRKCHSMFNTPENAAKTVAYPYCGMTFRLANRAAGNSEICYRRGKSEAKLFQMNIDSGDPPELCAALRNDNIFAFPTPVAASTVNETTTNRYMMVTARMDSFGMIPEVSAGEVSVLTSIISVIAAARSVGTQIEKWTKASEASKRNLFFAFFNGESLDYIGSGAAAYQMGKGTFPVADTEYSHIQPIRLNELDYVLEVQQVGVAKGRKYYAHVDGERYAKNKTQMERVIDRIERGLRSHAFDLEKPTDKSRVPPASWHSFAKVNQNVQAVVLAPFGEKYDYQRLNSVLDKNAWTSDEREKAIQEIEAVGTSILAAAADYVGLETDDVVAKVDKQLISTMFDCLVTSNFWFDCDFMQKLNGSRYYKRFDSYGFDEKSTYISMESHNPFSEILHWLTIFALGSDKDTLNVKTELSCSHLQELQAVQMYTYTWQPDPYTGQFSCLKSAIVKKEMVSPALDPRIQEEEMNEQYSTWMDSVYTVESVNLYLMEDSSFEYTMLIIAIASALISMFAVGRCSEQTFIVDEGEPAAEEGEPL